MNKILLSLMLIGATTLRAQDPISEAVSAIVANNPELQAQRDEMNVQALELKDENSLANPSVDFTRVWGRHGIGNKLQLDVSQEFDWPGLYRARSQATKFEISAAEAEIEAQISQTALEAKEKLLDLVLLRRQMALQQELMGYVRRMAQAMEFSYSHGQVTILDQKKLAIETYKIEAEIAAQESQERQLISELQQMAPGAQLRLGDVREYPVEPLLSMEEYQEQVRLLNPEYLALVSAQESAEAQARVARQQRFPGFSVGYEHQAEMGDRFNGLTAGIKLPFFENRHARSAALLRKQSAEAQAEAVAAQAEQSIRAEMAEAQAWRRQVEAYQRVFGDNAYMAVLQRAYDGGELSIIDYLGEIQYYREATASYLEAEHAYAVALARLNQWVR